VAQEQKPASQLENALDALRRGFWVHPCYPRTKEPATDVVFHGIKDATRDEAVVRRWWSRNPDYNPGVNAGVVVDCDTGLKSLDEALAWAKNVGLPPTLTIHTGRLSSYGVQFHFTGKAKKNGPYECLGVEGEFRLQNMLYGMAPGAIHPSGGRYEIVADLPTAPWPSQSYIEECALKTIKKLQQNPNNLKTGEKIKRSQRQYWLVSQCGRLRYTGLNGDALFSALRSLCDQYCESPEEKTDKMLQQICESGERNYGVNVPDPPSKKEKVFGSDRHALLEECAQKYCEEHAPEEPGDIDIRDEGMLFCDLTGVNAGRCAPPLPWSDLRKLSIRLFEQLTSRKVVIYPGMFEEAQQNTTDTGYGKHFIRDHGYFIRYNKETSEWLVYSKGVWRVAHDDVEVGRYFKEQFIEREREALLSIASLKKYLKEIEEKKFLDKSYVPTMLEQSTLDLFDKAMADLEAARHAQESRNINSALEQARTEVGVDCVNADLDTDPLAFNCLNAAIDLRSSESIKNRIHQLCTKQSKVIASDDSCPRFEQILERSLPDEQTRDYLQDFFGLCLSGLMVPDILIFLGDGANGKSLIRNIISGVLGDYHAKASMSTFLVSKNVNPGGARTDLAGFRGKRLITASEANRKVMLDMELLKDWTGNEDINARDLWQKGKHAQFQPQGKILLLMNHPPRVIDQSEGTWRRLKYARFDIIIPPEERNDKLAQEVLETEGSGVLNWMLTGWERVRMRLDAGVPGLITPEKISRDTTEYKEKESVITRFFEEELEAREGHKTRSADVYNCYAAWCKRNNEYQESSTELSLSLQRYCSDQGFKLEKAKVKGARGFSGLKLKETFNTYSAPE
jgi:P4 family phage/plasmid primase-like protien